MKSLPGCSCDSSEAVNFTRKELFDLLAGHLNDNANDVYEILQVELTKKFHCSYTLSADEKQTIRKLLYDMKDKWQKARRMKVRFMEKNTDWLIRIVTFGNNTDISKENKDSDAVRGPGRHTDSFETKQEPLEPVSPGDITIKNEFIYSGPPQTEELSHLDSLGVSHELLHSDQPGPSGLPNVQPDSDSDLFETKDEPLEPVSPGDIRIRDEFADSGAAVTTQHEELARLLTTTECSTTSRPKRLRTDGEDHWQADDPKLSAVLDILKKLSDRDDSGVYGEHVAMKMRSYSTETKSRVQHLINNVLFDADMGKFDNPFSAE